MSRMRRKQKTQPNTRFSHNPPGHTCGLPCCSDNVQIHPAKLSAPTPRYACLPTPYKQADLENNFTFRRNKLIPGRPSLSSKFFSLQTPGGAKGRVRTGLPTFHDDQAIDEVLSGDEYEVETSAHVASENLRKYKASIETDTDFDAETAQPYLERVDHDRSSVIRYPVRHLRPWECFHKREIIFPDLPSTPRKMVFLDYRPEESRDDVSLSSADDIAEKDEKIEVFTLGYTPPSATPARRRRPSDARKSSPRQTKVKSPENKSPEKNSGSRFPPFLRTKPRPEPVIQKSNLKKPRPESDDNESEPNSVCPICLGTGVPRIEHLVNVGEGCDTKGHGQCEGSDEIQSEGQFNPVKGHKLEVTLSDTPEDEIPEDFPDPPSDDDGVNDHVYDVLSDVAARAKQHGEDIANKYDSKPPPVPPARRNNTPQPDPGRKAITPEPKRKFPMKGDSFIEGDIYEEPRYSTFPTRKQTPTYEDCTPRGRGKNTLDLRRRDTLHVSKIFASDDEHLNLLDHDENEADIELDHGHIGEGDDEIIYEPVSHGFLSDAWGVHPRKGGGSLSSVDSARLSHTSYGSYGCTCLSGNTSRFNGGYVNEVTDDVTIGADVNAATDNDTVGTDVNVVTDDVTDGLSDVKISEESKEGVESAQTEKQIGQIQFLADSPITLIL